jgi:sugar lactone lactonase YvrE
MRRASLVFVALGALLLFGGCHSTEEVGPTTGGIVGTVSNSLGGTLTGLTVTVTSANGQTIGPDTVSSGGIYRVGNIPAAGGSGMIAVGRVPSACTTPAPIPYTGLTAGDTITVDITVVCTAQIGTVFGTVSTLVGGVATVIPNAAVTVTPAGGSAIPAATTSAAGLYNVADVPVGTGGGTVAVGGLPANCVTPAAVSYSGLTSGGSVTANVAVSCTPTTGNLTVTVTEPVGVTAGATVTAPNGTLYNVSGTETLTGLAAGVYTVTAPTSTVVPGTIVNSVYTSAVTGSPATVTVGVTTSASVTYTLRAGSGSAWVTNGNGTAVSFAASQLASSGSPTPPVTLSGLAEANALAFDGSGNLWIASGTSGNDELIEYAAPQLSASGAVTPTLTLTSTNSSISFPQQLTFDLSGNLWVANQHAGTVVEFTNAQLVGLTGTHALIPALTLTSADWGANGVGTLALDVNGTLWVYGSSSSHLGVYGYAASSLTGSGAVQPTTVLTSSAFVTGPQTVAFDPSGNLWVTTNSAVVSFTPAQQAAGGAETPTSTVAVPGNSFINAVGFDDSGDLWLADAATQGIFAFTPTQLAAGGSPTPAISIASSGGSLSGPTAIGFDPHGVGVPLAGGRVTGAPRGRTVRRR